MLALRITEWLKLEATSEGHLAQPCVQAGLPRTGCKESYPDDF